MNRRFSLNILVLVVAFMALTGPYLARAFADQKERSLVANVDMERVFAQSSAKLDAEKRLNEAGSRLFTHFQQATRLTYATPAELESYTSALETETQTDATKQTITKIEADVQARRDEVQKLSTTKDTDLTAKDRARLRELTTISDQARQAMDAVKRLYDRKLADEETQFTRDAQAQVREIVGKLAKEQGFQEVYDTTAMVYAPVDLTPMAIQRVKPKP